ncbi:MAG: hypothetical protein ACU0CC_14730 [Sagittula sp.]|uniref:hypothetical protein n=1 Tax=Sagittula sp. TaxID=2038081 RepID=UPI004058DB40
MSVQNTIRERLIQEIVRRLRANEIATAFDDIRREEIPDDYDPASGAVLAVLEGREVMNATGTKAECALPVFFSFVMPVPQEQEAQTVANNVAGTIIKALSGQHTLEEGGDGSGGTKLGCIFVAEAVQPEYEGDERALAAATVEFALLYRHRARDPFSVGP